MSENYDNYDKIVELVGNGHDDGLLWVGKPKFLHYILYKFGMKLIIYMIGFFLSILLFSSSVVALFVSDVTLDLFIFVSISFSLFLYFSYLLYSTISRCVHSKFVYYAATNNDLIEVDVEEMSIKGILKIKSILSFKLINHGKGVSSVIIDLKYVDRRNDNVLMNLSTSLVPYQNGVFAVKDTPVLVGILRRGMDGGRMDGL